MQVDANVETQSARKTIVNALELEWIAQTIVNVQIAIMEEKKCFIRLYKAMTTSFAIY
jgi:hypothetical protein